MKRLDRELSSTTASTSSLTATTALGLQGLLDEPVRLSNEAQRLNAELEALVIENYKVFIENLTCSVHLRLEDRNLVNLSTELESNLKELAQKCQSFKDRVSNFVSSHRRNRKTLQHHMQLVELLEVPQLVDACCRNGFHDEALELANFVNGLERRHILTSEVKSSTGALRAGSGVIQTIVDDVHQTLSGLRRQLLVQLTENIALPKEIAILGTLRKLDVLLIDRYLSLERRDATSHDPNGSISLEQSRSLLLQNSEVRLQMDFLEARSIWLSKTAKTLPSSSTSVTTHSNHSNAVSGSISPASAPVHHNAKSSLGPYGRIIELLELRRTAWFSVITQYKALFADEREHIGKDVKHSTVSNYSCDTVLNTWISCQVQNLLSELQRLLPDIDDGASMRSILEQTLYFSSRMGQVGCDFSGLVLPIFSEVISSRFQMEVSNALEHCKTMILTERISFNTSDGDAIQREQVIPLYSAQDAAVSSLPIRDKGDSDAIHRDNNSIQNEFAVPKLLMRFPPLAYLLNSILSVLNYVRECPMLGLRCKGLQMIFDSFNELCRFVAQKKQEILQIGRKYSNDSFIQDLGFKSGGPERGPLRHSAKAQDKEGYNSEATMDKLYSQAIACELLPHVLLCFDSIYVTNASKLEARLRTATLLDSKRDDMSHIRQPADGSHTQSSALPCLVTCLADFKDLAMDDSTVRQIERVWKLLIENELLDGRLLTRVPVHVKSDASHRHQPLLPVTVAVESVAEQRSSGDITEAETTTTKPKIAEESEFEDF